MKKELSHVMLKLETAQCGDGTVKCEKKVRKPPNVAKELSYVILEPHNVRIKPSNVRKKSKRTTKYDKRTVTCDFRTAQCEDGTVKCEKKVREPPNMRKELSL